MELPELTRFSRRDVGCVNLQAGGPLGHYTVCLRPANHGQITLLSVRLVAWQPAHTHLGYPYLSLLNVVIQAHSMLNKMKQGKKEQ